MGVEYESYGLTGYNGIRLNETLKSFVNLSDQSILISKLRLVKSEAEIKYIKKAAKLADESLKEAWNFSHSGVNEAEVLAAMQGSILKGGGDYPANEFIIGSGENDLLCRYFSHMRLHLSAK